MRSSLFSKAETLVTKAGKPIFQKGAEGLWLATVMSGRVRICLRGADGREMLISMIERGEMFGERAVFDGRPRSGDAIAEVDTSLYDFQARRFDARALQLSRHDDVYHQNHV